MTAAQLIALLQALPPDRIVCVGRFGSTDIVGIEERAGQSKFVTAMSGAHWAPGFVDHVEWGTTPTATIAVIL